MAVRGDRVWLGADLLTGGPKPSFGGVYKLVRRGKRGIVKMSETKEKTTDPDDKKIVVVTDAQNKVVRRVTVGENERLKRRRAPGKRLLRATEPTRKCCGPNCLKKSAPACRARKESDGTWQ